MSAFRHLGHLVQDYDDNNVDIVSSFGDLRRNTLQTLYNVGSSMRDKSPKGSIDTAIQPLVDLINFHPSFTTLSSCSGRISLFDPYLSGQTQENLPTTNTTIDEDGATENTLIPSGKGHGGWLLVSHDRVGDPSSLSKLLDETTGSDKTEMNARMLAFKMEPLLLHVAAATIQRGRQLLNLALSLGFRESGLIVSTSKITVAIRGHSLALSLPLARTGPLRPSNDYLNALMEEANDRLSANEEKLLRLTKEVETTLFRTRPQESLNQCNATFHSISKLNMWGYAAVIVEISKSDNIDMLVFGGYGRGPDVLSSGGSLKNNPENRASCRSDRIYSLSKKDGIWSNYWAEVIAMPLPNEESQKTVKTWYGLETVLQSFTAREGADACLLPLGDNSKPVVALWGGRAGPLRPKNELLLYEPITRQGIFVTPRDIRGEPPSPRWGHTLTALNGTNGHLALLMGGRNDKTSLGSVHMLSIIQNSADDRHMLWQTIQINFPPQFHHTTIKTADEEDHLIVFGGVSDPNDMIEAFSNSFKHLDAITGVTHNEGDTHRVQPFSSFQIDVETCTASEHETLFDTCCIDELVPFAFAASACTIDIPSSASLHNSKQLVFLCGGTPHIDPLTNVGLSDDESPFRCFTTSRTSSKDPLDLVPYQAKIITTDSQDIDFGSMVHHRVLSAPYRSRDGTSNGGEILLLGGGVSSFAFGACFSESYRVELSLCKENGSSVDANNLLTPKMNSNNSQPFVESTRPVHGANNAKTEETNVIYVGKKNAKALKTALEADGFLNKTFRMTSAHANSEDWDPKLHIAVPTTKACLQEIEGRGMGETPPWKLLVLGTGTQEMPFSTAILGLKKR